MDDSLQTIYYTLTWFKTGDIRSLQIVALIDQTSYKITGLDLDTAYTVTVAAANTCGQEPEFRTSVILSTDTTSATSSINPSVTASTNPMATSNSIPNRVTTTTALTTANIYSTVTAVIPSPNTIRNMITITSINPISTTTTATTPSYYY